MKEEKSRPELLGLPKHDPLHVPLTSDQPGNIANLRKNGKYTERSPGCRAGGGSKRLQSGAKHVEDGRHEVCNSVRSVVTVLYRLTSSKSAKNRTDSLLLIKNINDY